MHDYHSTLIEVSGGQTTGVICLLTCEFQELRLGSKGQYRLDHPN